jgi:hypothetical protein
MKGIRTAAILTLALLLAAPALAADRERWLVSFDDGRPKEEGWLDEDGEKVGVWTVWLPTGRKKEEGEYQNGKKHGRWVYWYASGKKLKEGTYRGGKPHGMWTYWYENGKLQQRGTFRNGKRHGEWIYYDDRGNEHRGRGRIQPTALHDHGIPVPPRGTHFLLLRADGKARRA